MSPAIILFRTSSFALIVASVMSPTAHAALGLAFSANDSFSTFNITPGGNLSIPIYLRQSSANASHPDFIATHGLNVFGVAGKLDNGGVSFVDNAISFESPFADQGLLNPSTSTLSSFLMNGFDARLGSPGVTGEAILLGSITVHANTPGAMATLTLSDPDVTLDDFATSPNFGSFDAKVFASSATATIAVVPEGSSIVLAATALISLAVIAACRYRSARRSSERTEL